MRACQLEMHGFQVKLSTFHSKYVHFTLKCIKQLIFRSNLLVSWVLVAEGYLRKWAHFKLKCAHFKRSLPGMVVLWLYFFCHYWIDNDVFLLYLHALFYKIHKSIEKFFLCSQVRTKCGNKNVFTVSSNATIFAGKFCKNYFKGLLNFQTDGSFQTDLHQSIHGIHKYKFHLVLTWLCNLKFQNISFVCV